VAPTRAAPPPENFGAAASRIFDGAPTQAGSPADFTAASRKRVGGGAEGSRSNRRTDGQNCDG